VLADPDACACIDFSGSDEFIDLTSSSDCARVTGDDNYVYARRPRRSVARRKGPATARHRARRAWTATTP